MVKNDELHYLVTDIRPKDLDLFEFESMPITILFFPFYFCLFGNVILVFDKKGVFSIALDPSALRIDIKRESIDCMIQNGNFPRDKFADTDSKCLNIGDEWHTWKYTCIDGSPDLRYHSNYRINIQNNKYEYGIITLSIVSKTATINVSSEDAINAFELLIKKYTRKCNDKNDPIFSLLKLLEICSDKNDETMLSLIEEYKKMEGKRNYFCCIKDS